MVLQRKETVMLEFDVSQSEYYSGTFEIAREGDFGYDAEGYAALVKDGKAAIVHISHCSCYGTWDQNESPPWEWTGTVDELVRLAARQGDLEGLLDRPLDPAKDYGTGYLLAVYAKIVEWDKNGRK
jgi:hypothetical protein